MRANLKRVTALSFACAAFTIFVGFAKAQAASHPLDGLTAAEYWTVLDVLQASGHVNSDTRYPFITLREPPKSELLEWKPGRTFRREAFAIVKQGAKTFEAIVDVTNGKLISWQERTGVQPNLIDDDESVGTDDLKDNPDFQAAMRRRGITNYSTIVCGGASPGYFGTPEEQGRRLMRIGCNDRRYAFEPDSRFLTGLTIVWDSNERKVIRVIDTGAVPVARAASDYDPASVGPLRKIPTPIDIEQPLGPSFRIDGHEISWQNWHFHFRVDRRVGLIVSNVGYDDGGRRRPILYEGSLSEIFVPYMNPAEDWYWATYIDAGEFASGFSSSLETGIDCPENAVYFDQVFADNQGLPALVPRAACLFERSAGDIAWRHSGRFDPVESRKRRDLVLRTVATFGNYDYVFDWVFRQDGAIQIAVGLTGIDEVESANAKSASQDTSGKQDAYGRFVADHTVAPYHDHYFSFRLNFDVDGPANSFIEDRLAVERLPSSSPRKSVWVARPVTLKTESEAKLRVSDEHPAIWRVVNPNVKSATGYPVGYEIVPGDTAWPLLSPDDYPQRRAGFSDYQLWVTPFRDDERFAAGLYPTQSKGGDGLPLWTRANRPIENTDIVVWYTMGFHHVPSAEDFPVMPTNWLKFELRPFNFFSRNPALDLPR